MASKLGKAEEEPQGWGVGGGCGGGVGVGVGRVPEGGGEKCGAALGPCGPSAGRESSQALPGRHPPAWLASVFILLPNS